MLRVFHLALLLQLLAATFTSLNSTGAHAAERSDKRPNILYVLLDNVGKDWFRCYGSQENQTPNMDRLAASGIQFRNCYVTPVCSTTRHMLLTGRYPFRTGWHTHHDAAIYGGGYFDWNREIAFARVLKSAGYDTCISGKWQINDLFDPKQKDALKKHGFDEHCIFPEGPKGHAAHKKRYWDAYIMKNRERIDTTGKFGPDICTDYLIDFMRKHRDRPFLAYYSAILTHIPVVTTPHNPDERATTREKFAGMLHYADHLIGQLVSALDELGLRENTILCVMSDNGTDNGTDQGDEQSLGGRVNGRISDEGIYSMTERGINVPFIVNCPKLVPGGRFSDSMVDASDILPTLAELAGAKLPEGVAIDGQSFATELLGKSLSDRRPWCHTQYYTRRVVRDQRFKLYSTGEFYDLAADPLEQHNLSGSKTLADDHAAITAQQQLQKVLGSFPLDAQLWFEPRSISARRLRAERQALEKAVNEP